MQASGSVQPYILSQGLPTPSPSISVCEKLNIQLSDLTSKTDINLQNTISEILDDTLFEDLDILVELTVCYVQ